MDDDLWTDILQAFEQEAGEHPASKPEGWELCLLARVAASRLESTKSVRKTLAKRIERLLLAAEPRLDDCRGVLARGLGNAIELSAPIQEARRLVSRSLTSRSRSPRRESLRQAHTLLEKAGSAWKNQPDAVEVAANLLSAGEALSLEEISARTLVAVACAAYRNPLRMEATRKNWPRKSLRKLIFQNCRKQSDIDQATLGPPAFFPVGNAAGRFEALQAARTDGLCPEGELRLLFIGARSCIVDCLRLSLRSELPVVLLPLIAAAAKSILDTGQSQSRNAMQLLSCYQYCAWAADSNVLKNWWTAWMTEGCDCPEVHSLIKSVFMAGEHSEVLSALNVPCLEASWNPFEAQAALRYEKESTTPRQAICLAFKGSLRLQLTAIATGTGKRSLPAGGRKLAMVFCYGLQLMDGYAQRNAVARTRVSPVEARQFDRVFTSNVADHVGVPALALALAPLGGELLVCLSNNLRALDLSGDIKALFLKMHGITLEAVFVFFLLSAFARKMWTLFVSAGIAALGQMVTHFADAWPTEFEAFASPAIKLCIAYVRY
ncbi:unnamed protein product [Symbiodinium sp. KB8]|nr:unnamed protein product [Symbiodinium sp. KB8]